jgi:protein O-mannosyl-transferase
MPIKNIYTSIPASSLLLAIIAFLVYAPSLGGEFVYDDKAITVEDNPALTGEASIGEILTWDRPLREFTYMLDHAIWDFNPLGYHLQNILWHCANTVLIFLLLMQIGISRKQSFWCALIFSIHPITTESVAWISGRKELLCLFFELGACLFFVRSIANPKSSPWVYALSLLCCILALLSKQVAVALPLMLCATAWLHQRCNNNSPNKHTLYLLITPTLIVIGFVLFKYPILDQLSFFRDQGTFYDPASRDVAYTPFSAILTPFATFLKSNWLCLWPIDLTVEQAFPPIESVLDYRWIIGALILLVMSIMSWRLRKIRPQLLFGCCWFLITWGPVSGAAPIAYLVADRYLYIPCVGYCIILVTYIYPLIQKRLTRFPALSTSFVIIICLFFTTRTIVRTLDWRNEITLWKSAIQARPDYAQVHASLGNSYADAGQIDNAFKAWNTALEIDDNLPRVWINMGNQEKRRGRLEDAERCFRKALELAPNYGVAHFNLALLLEKQNNPEAALRHFKIAAKHIYHRRNTKRRKGLANYHIARLLFAKGDDQTAVFYLNHAENLAPLHAPLYILKGLLHQYNPAIAQQSFETAIKLDPKAPEGYYNLGVLLWSKGNHEAAEDLWKKAINLNPELTSNIESIQNHDLRDKK